jgi:uncharacterized DUF497 family protein
MGGSAVGDHSVPGLGADSSFAVLQPEIHPYAQPFDMPIEFEWDRLVVVAHTDRGRRIRIINARRATRQERVSYEEGQ